MPRIQHLYLHIPFCRRRCAYCDFNTYANLDDRIEAYVEALCIELKLLAAETAAAPIQHVSQASAALHPTIFFGGGTPSMLTLEQLEQILRAVDALIPIDAAEITVEANPGTVLGDNTDAQAYLRGLRALGVNRLSLGVQSLHDPTLRVLGRSHTAAEAYRCFEDARRVGFTDINLDFIFGLPGQTLDQWCATLDVVLTWGADHFSLYSLILEERAPLYAQVMNGLVSLPDDDDVAAMYEAAIMQFAAADYEHYEISNWARAEKASFSNGNGRRTQPLPFCHHNLAYWLNSDYLAAGAGAHGHTYPQRYYNILDVDGYIAAVRAGGRPVASVITLAPEDLWAETMFMGLRINAGVSRDHFAQRCGVTLEEAFGPTLAMLIEQGLLESDKVGVRLTPRGRMLGNRVFEHFV